MSCWALVPIKRRSAAKKRLAARLSPAQRLQLTRLMLEGVVAALRDARCIDAVAFVSCERDTVPADFAVLPDAGGGLNAALDGARQSLIGKGASEIVVLPADLPLVTGAEIDALVESGRAAGFALASDRAGRGTNALYLQARTPFRFQFGKDSRARHLDEAVAAGFEPVVVDLPGLAFDVDDPEDLDRLLAELDPRYTLLAPTPGGNRCPTQRETRLG